jgi:hypothetical protein
MAVLLTGEKGRENIILETGIMFERTGNKHIGMYDGAKEVRKYHYDSAEDCAEEWELIKEVFNAVSRRKSNNPKRNNSSGDKGKATTKANAKPDKPKVQAE